MNQHRNIFTSYDQHDHEFFFPVAPLGVNNMLRSTQNGRRFKTASTKNWETLIDIHMLDNLDEVEGLKKAFIEGEHLLEVSFNWFIPLPKAITKRGSVSKKIGDTDNFIKPIQDKIMDACDIDDCYIWRYKNILRIPNEKPGIWCGVNVIPIKEVEHYSKHCK